MVLNQVMAPKQPNTGLFVGLNKGHVVTKKELAPRPSDRKGVSRFNNVLVFEVTLTLLLQMFHVNCWDLVLCSVFLVSLGS